MSVFLILESGATKVAWLAADANRVFRQGELDGLHPFLSSAQDWQQGLSTLQAVVNELQVKQIYYYGTGCSQEAGCTIVRQNLRSFWPDCTEVSVNSDLLAASRACWQRQEGIACILGTGSNAAWYDGAQIRQKRGGIGYVLGDEGSGADLGKQLLVAFLNEQLPDALMQVLRQDYGLDRAVIIERTYKDANPSRFLAQFAPLVCEWKHQSAFLQDQVCARFQILTRNYLFPLCQAADHTAVGFVGSIAVNFEAELAAALAEKGLKIHENLGNPTAELLRFHQS